MNKEKKGKQEKPRRHELNGKTLRALFCDKEIFDLGESKRFNFHKVERDKLIFR